MPAVVGAAVGAALDAVVAAPGRVAVAAALLVPAGAAAVADGAGVGAVVLCASNDPQASNSSNAHSSVIAQKRPRSTGRIQSP